MIDLKLINYNKLKLNLYYRRKGYRYHSNHDYASYATCLFVISKNVLGINEMLEVGKYSKVHCKAYSVN